MRNSKWIMGGTPLNDKNFQWAVRILELVKEDQTLRKMYYTGAFVAFVWAISPIVAAIVEWLLR